MPFYRYQYKLLRTDSGESEAISPITSFGRICKCPPSILAELGHKGRLHASHPRFGPFYREDESEVTGKKDAWDKILEKSVDKKKSDDQSKSDDKNKALENYLSAMRRIERDARKAYGEKALYNITESEFRWMMIEDGCLFLQLVLFVLGVPFNILGYSESNIIFGKKPNKENVKRWIEAMFFPGNQLPLVVLTELMKQRFFQEIINQVEWEIPSDLPKRILYELLISPALESPPLAPRDDQGLGAGGRVQQASNLLHALHSLMLGPRGGGSFSDPISVILQDETGDDDLERGDPDLLESKDTSFSATELQKKGIRFGKVEKLGCTAISFTDYIIFARLYLPTFTVDDDTELLCKSLKCYEMSQQQLGKSKGKGKGRCEVRSYLHFMNDLICSYEDVKLLSKKGIIKVTDTRYKEKLPKMLSKLAGKGKTTTEKLHLVRIQLRDYNMAPWERFKIVALAVFVLTFIQAFFAVLAYFRPPPQK